MRIRKHFQVIFHSAHHTNKPRDQFPTSFALPEVEKIFQDFQSGAEPENKVLIIALIVVGLFVSVAASRLFYLWYKFRRLSKSERQAKWPGVSDKFVSILRITMWKKPIAGTPTHEKTTFSSSGADQYNNTGSGSQFSSCFMFVSYRFIKSTRNSQQS
jgi:hypothetical protein